MAESLDNQLERERQGKLNHRAGQHSLPLEPAPPAQPASSRLNHTATKNHPSRDSKVDSDEEYQEG